MTPHRRTRSSSSVSIFVLFLQRATEAQPSATKYGLDGDSTSPRHLLDYIHDHLPHSSLLTLRLVSRVMKHYIDHSQPSRLSHLHLTLPLMSPPSLPDVKDLLQHCTHLKFTIITPRPAPPATAKNEKPFSLTKFFKLLPNLTTLHISLPSPTVTPLHHTTLLSIRHALEDCSYELKHLTTLRLHPITVRGLISLRSGAFSCFETAEWMRGKFWQGITTLEVGMDGFLWEGKQADGDGDGDDEEWAVREERAKRKRDTVRMGLKILHDFLHDLAPSLRVLQFEWLDAEPPWPRRFPYPHHHPATAPSAPPSSSSSTALPSSASSTAPPSSASTAPPPYTSQPPPNPNPNPLLLDLEIPRLFPPRNPAPGPITKWFTAPPTLWPALRELRLGGVGVGADDVAKLRGRAGGLRGVGVWEGWGHGGEWGRGGYGGGIKEEDEDADAEVGGAEGDGAEANVEWWNQHWRAEDRAVLPCRLRTRPPPQPRRAPGARWTRFDVRHVPGSPVGADGIGRAGCAGGAGRPESGINAKDLRNGNRAAEMGKHDEEGDEWESETQDSDGGEGDRGRGVESMMLTFVLDTGGRDRGREVV